MTRQIGFGTYLGDFMLPTLIGNTIGGVSLATALNHTQVASGKKNSQ